MCIFAKEDNYFFYEHNGVYISRVDFDVNAFADEYFDREDILRPSDYNKCAVKRKAEYLAGRIAAKRLLSLGLGLKTDIISNPDRSPSWPHGVYGSITHTEKTALAVITKNTTIGIDVERVLDTQSAADIGGMVMSNQEKSLITEFDSRMATTLIFSAKESIFKCLYPDVLCYFDFKDASLIHVDTKESLLIFEINKDLSPKITKGLKVIVAFNAEDCVFTLAMKHGDAEGCSMSLLLNKII